MNTRRFSVVLMVVCLPVAVMAAFLDAPTWEDVTVNGGVFLDWTDVDGAVKYSADIEGTVTYLATILVDGVETVVETTSEVEVSFGTSDRTDGGLMGDSNLTITIVELATAIADELGIAVEDLESFDGSVKVKGLNPPGKNSNPQNNLFSESEILQVTFL